LVCLLNQHLLLLHQVSHHRDFVAIAALPGLLQFDETQRAQSGYLNDTPFGTVNSFPFFVPSLQLQSSEHQRKY
uniref:Uncharacterized protein n=1 Tax=Amphimedon queenslandica TaxID=400682 RepID=A0A1X7U4D1_AMPQE